MNKMSVRRNRAVYIPSETSVCAKKGNLLAPSMHRGALQKANSLHEQGRRDAMSHKTNCFCPNPWGQAEAEAAIECSDYLALFQIKWLIQKKLPQYFCKAAPWNLSLVGTSLLIYLYQNLIYLYQKDSTLLDFVFFERVIQFLQGQVAFDS